MLRRKLRCALAGARKFLCIFVIILFIIVCTMKKMHHDEVVSKIHKSALKYVEFVSQEESNKPQLNSIKHLIRKYNSEESVLNLDLFGPLNPNAPVFVIFVDKFKINLKYLLASLAQVMGIEKALVIFSHSRYDENVNNLIQTIDFTKVLQIFYPYSLQVYLNSFPGFEQGDCPQDMDMDTAQSINCTGADSPDIRGRYRDPLQAQTKHYWWWTMNKVFENLSHTKDHTGIFTFLEDDVFLMEDFIFLTLQMNTICPLITKCEFISLETSRFEFSFFEMNTYTVELKHWDPKDHSSVLSFDSSLWSSIAGHYYLFCYIDDYSWSRSLYYLSLNRKDGGRFKVMSSTMPRAFKTSSSALYDRFLKYDMMHTIFRIMDMQERKKVELYPSHLEIYYNIELEMDDFVSFDYVENSGGWNDPRDKEMCNNITTKKIKKIIMDMDRQFQQYDNLAVPNY